MEPGSYRIRPEWRRATRAVAIVPDLPHGYACPWEARRLSDQRERPGSLVVVPEEKRRLYEEVTTYGEGSPADVEEEIRQLDGLLEKDPENLAIREWLAFKLYSIGRYDRAAFLYRELIDRDHRAGVQYFYLGNTYFKMRRIDSAREAWLKTIQLIPADAKAQKARARIERLDRDEEG
jgi:tetratricopeptide (TPR) repeat protein